MLASRALSSMRRSFGLVFGSPPPCFAATVISLMRRVKTLPFFASAAALRCLMFAHLLWPAIAIIFLMVSSPLVAPLLMAKSGGTELNLLPALANRHGLITGATGTGKSVTLQALAQRF